MRAKAKAAAAAALPESPSPHGGGEVGRAAVAEAAASPGAVVGAPYRSPAGAPVSLGPGDGGRIAPGPPHNDLTAGPGAIEDGPAPLPVDDGGFVTMRHRCTACGVVREVLIPSIDGIDVRELRGRCAQCERTPEAPDGPVLGPVDRGAVLRAPVEQEQRPPYVEHAAGGAAVAGRGAQGDAGRLLGADSR